jgi:dTDP-4-amino-4,6-dideoxygalactose transaminase
MSVPLLDLKRQYEPMREAIETTLKEVAASQYFILGPEVEKFEHEAATWLGSEFAVGVASGTDALLISLMALDIGPGDEVILPTFTFFATAGVVARLGATPVFVDIDPVDFCLDCAQVAERLSDRTKAVIPVHLFGQSADLAALRDVVGEVPVVEDCAQAWGADFEARYVGNHGVCGAFSFFPSKNLGGFGDGGLVTTNDTDFAAKLKELRMHGQSGPYLHPTVGGNFRLDAIQAAVLRVKLPYVQNWVQARRANAMRYVDAFTQEGLHEILGLPLALSGRGHTFNQFVIRAPRRDDLRRRLTDRGIGCAVYYPLPLHLQPCFTGFGGAEGDCPVAEQASAEVLALPIFPELTDEELAEVVGAIAEFYGI